LKLYEKQLLDLKTKAFKLNSYEEVLSLSKTRFSGIGSLNDDLSTKLLLWTASKKWEKYLQSLNKSKFREIKVEQVQQIAEEYSKSVAKCKKKIPLSNEKLARLDTNIKNFCSVLPVIIALNNKLLEPSHFKEINSIVGFDIDEEGLQLNQLLCASVLDNQKQIIEMSVQVRQEDRLKRDLDEIDKKIAILDLPLKPFKEENSKESTYILDDCTKLLAEIDKLIQMINSIYGSRYLKDLRTRATNKRKDILLLQDTLNEWIKFQKNYIYLESIFSQSEMKKSLMQEGKEFEEQVNKQYKANIKKVMTHNKMPQLFKHNIVETLFNCFKKHNGILHALNKRINNFLDSKRENFPRFYFIPNEELIYILANYDNPEAVQTFIGKLFQNVHK
jgi:dynein heavy chain